MGLLMGAGLLVIFGLSGLYARQAERAGVLGLISFVMTFVGLLFSDVIATEKYAFLFPKLAASPEGRALLTPEFPEPTIESAIFPVILIGVLLLGITIWRAKVFPRWIGFLFIASPLTLPLAFVVPASHSVGPLLIYLGFASCGYALAWGTAEVSARRAEPGSQVS